MTIKELKKTIRDIPDDAEIIVSSDEEMNILYRDWDICKLSGTKDETYVIFGINGSDFDPETIQENEIDEY